MACSTTVLDDTQYNSPGWHAIQQFWMACNTTVLDGVQYNSPGWRAIQQSWMACNTTVLDDTQYNSPGWHAIQQSRMVCNTTVLDGTVQDCYKPNDYLRYCMTPEFGNDLILRKSIQIICPSIVIIYS